METGGFEFLADGAQAVVLGAQFGGEGSGLPEKPGVGYWVGAGRRGRRGGLAWGERAAGLQFSVGEVGDAQDRERAGHVLGEDIGGLLRIHAQGRREQCDTVGFALRDAKEAGVLGVVVPGWASLDHEIDEPLALVGEDSRELMARGRGLRVGKGRLAEQHDDQAGGHGPDVRTMHDGMVRLKPAQRERMQSR